MMIPALPDSVKSLGDLMQIAYVTADIQKAANFWTRLGVGPFFVMEDARKTMESFTYRGMNCDADITVMIAYWGDLQIELIQQHDTVPSVYREGTTADQGVHHICIIVDEIDAATARCAAMGGWLIQAGVSGENRFVYMDMGGGPGTILEMLAPSPEVRAYQAHMKQSARDWDGDAPFRPFGS